MAGICFDGVTKRYDDGTLAVEELDLDVPDGGFTVLVGPSGCGKSTALRMIAGLEDVSEGAVTIGGRVVNDLAPKDRDIAMVFQSYALYPHMTVADNMGFALKMHGVDKAEIRRRVEGAADMLGITDLLAKRPRSLSGGQRQRVALGRSVVREPQAFLMDEPLSNLDAKLRVEMRGYLQGLHGELGITTVYVTHDQTEAMTMGDRVAVMRGGRLEQADAPQRLYDAPANVFVAGFIGSPAMNLARGRIDDGGRLCLGHVRLDLGARGRALANAPVVAGIRPETLRLADAATPDDRVIDVPVVLVEALGADVLAHTELDAEQVLTGDLEEVAAELGSASPAGVAEGRTRLTARLEGTSRVRVGDRLRLTVDPEAIHLFDAATEVALQR